MFNLLLQFGTICRKKNMSTCFNAASGNAMMQESNDEQTEITKETAKTTQKTTDKKSAVIGNDKTDTGVKQESKKSVPEKAVEAIHKTITEAGAKRKVDFSKWNLDRLYGHEKEISA